MSDNEFKKMFKYYKQKEPPPSFDEVLDPADGRFYEYFKEIQIKEPKGNFPCKLVKCHGNR